MPPAPAPRHRLRPAAPAPTRSISRCHQDGTRGLGDTECLVKHEQRPDQLHAEHHQPAAERKGHVQGSVRRSPVYASTPTNPARFPPPAG